jgi:large subunit ribosomal protein L4
MEAQIFNQKGTKSGNINLPETVFGLSWNADLVHQVVTGIKANKRTLVAHTKDRSEVHGRNEKPWRQKGTGRSRHGSKTSPIWRKGGVAHGPRNEKVYAVKINKKMRAKALFVVLSKKFKDGEIIFLDSLNFEAPKTKEAREVMMSLSKIKGYEKVLNKKRNSLYLATDEKDKNTEKSFNNFGNVKVGEVRNLNPYDLLNYKYLLIENPEKSLAFIESRLSTPPKSEVKPKVKAKSKVAKAKK